MKSKKLLKISAVAISLIIIVSLLCGCGLLTLLIGSQQTVTEDEKAAYILETVYDYIQNKYVDELTQEQLDAVIDAGANAMLGLYDNYGFLINPEQYHDLLFPTSETSDGRYYGFSFIYAEYLGLKVYSTVTDSNSYGKLFAGDIITSIKNADGSPITYDVNGEQKTLNVKVSDLDTVADILSDIDSIRVTVTRGGTYENAYEDGQTLELLLTRGPIDLSYSKGFEYVEYYFGDDVNNVSPTTINLRNLSELNGTDIGYIRITQFSSTYDLNDYLVTDTISEVKEALQVMVNAGKTKLILDLKGNPGGDVDQVKNVAGCFIYEEGKVGNSLLVTTMKERDATQTYSVKSSYDNYFDRSQGIQILVATDGNSASASELLLGAMLDYNTCVHIGETSFGKGIAQYIEPILKGTFERDGKTYTSYYGIYYTAAYYYTPNGINIHHIGFTPDEQYRAYDYEDIMGITLNYFGY